MIKRAAVALAAVATLATGVLPATAGVTAPTPGNTQVGGVDRYSTAVSVSKSFFTPGVDLVVVASSVNFPDGLAGGAIAANAMGPLLLTAPAALPASVKSELQRLQPAAVMITGGTGVVSPAVESAIRSALPGAYVERIAGADRYSGAAAVSRAYYADGAQTIYVSSGQGFADAVSAAAPAGLTAGPLLLADRTLPAATRDEIVRLKGRGLLENVVVLGGTGSVSATAYDQIRSLMGKDAQGYDRTMRVSGANRFETSANSASLLWGGPGNTTPPPAKSVFYVNGWGWADALTAGPAAAANDAPVLLTNQACMPAATKKWDVDHSSTLTSRVWIGGTGALTATTNAC